MAVTLKQHADLVARRHELIREIEVLHGELAEVNRQLNEPIKDKLVTKPGTVRHAVLKAVRGGHDQLVDITAVVSVDLGRDIGKHAAANELRALRNVGLVLHADHRWMPAKEA